MATHSMTTDRFPAGTTVTVYPLSNWPFGAQPPSAAPIGSSTTSAAVSSASVLTFTGLTPGVRYVATADVSGTYRYVAFTAPTSSPDYGRDFAQAGMYAPGGPIQNTTTTVSASNVARFGRFVPSEDFTVSSISFATTVAAGSNDAVSVGLYDSAGTRLVTSGAVSGKLNATPGVQNVEIDNTPVSAGTVYFAGISYGTLGSTATTFVAMGVTNAVANTLFGSGLAVCEQAFIASGAHPLPTTMTGWATSTLCPLMALIEA